MCFRFSKKILSIVVFCFFSCRLMGQDYERYHKLINKAEYKIFVENSFDSGLEIYKKLFQEYDFAFANDCIVAMQIAIFTKREDLFLYFIAKSFENGVKLESISQIKYISNSDYFVKKKDQIERLYIDHRSHYLNRIDKDLLNQTLRLFANDQLVKNGLKGKSETVFKQNKEYLPKITNTIKELKRLSLLKGIPSDRLIGLDQNDIMKELKSSDKDLIEYYNDFASTSDYTVVKSQFEQNELSFCSHLILPLMHHLEGSFYQFDSAFYMSQIKKGNLHPKDLAAINDFPYAIIPPKPISKNGLYFGVGIRFVSPNSLCISDSMINQNRKDFFIQNIEYDRKKWEFMFKNKMFNSFGYLGCRS